jgi:hypothetical protein
LGTKLLDGSIDPEDILSGTLRSEIVEVRPKVMPISADWPEEIYKATEFTWTLETDSGVVIPLSDVDIIVDQPDTSGPLRFRLDWPGGTTTVELELFKSAAGPDFRFVRYGSAVSLRRGESEAVPLEDYSNEEPPVVWFADGSQLLGNQRWSLRHPLPSFDPSKILGWDWDGIDITKESQGLAKDAATIQGRLINKLKVESYDVDFDDDGSGELGDVVAIRVITNNGAATRFDVEIYHCKFPKETTPGRRVGDLYEVCGQTFKSTSWMVSAEKRSDIFTHLMRREAARRDAGLSSRIERGDMELLHTIREMSRSLAVEPTIFIVQPGLISGDASNEQLQLLGVAKNYLDQTYQIPLRVVGSVAKKPGKP